MTACVGKLAYPSSGAAAQVLRRMTSRDAERGRNKPYHCEECGYWHLGNPPQVDSRKLHEAKRRQRRFERMI